MDILVALALLPASVVALLWYMGWAARQGVTFPTMALYGSGSVDPVFHARMFRRGLVAAFVTAVVAAPFVWVL